MTERKRARAWTERQVADLVRGRILSGIHGGTLSAGDRLATYREVADESGLDLRAVARVYRQLQEEGLVEVRGRRGVFVAEQARIGGAVLEETARWMVAVLQDAWMRRIRLPDFPAFAERLISSVEVRCVCIESTEDQLQTLSTELQRDFGLTVSPLHAGQLATVERKRGLQGMPRELAQADLIVTTSFHAASVRRIAEILRKPLVIVRLNPDLVRELERRLAAAELTVVCVDPRFLERIRMVVGPELEGRIRGVLIHDEGAMERLDPRKPVLLSHAARERLGTNNLPSIFPREAVLSAESAQELAEMIVRLNLDPQRNLSSSRTTDEV